jgi:phosphopantetheinyl transferase
LVLQRLLSFQEDLYLHDHLFIPSGPMPLAERVAIVPLTMSLELAAEAASLLVPGLRLVGLENARARHWIHVKGTGDEPLQARCVREEAAAGAEVERVAVTFTFEGQVCFSVTALFAGAYRQDLELDFATPGDAGPWPYAVEQVYGERRLFHGPRFQGITGLGQMGNPASTAVLTVLPRDRLFASQPQPEFLSDPCLMDAMGQVFGLWASTHGLTIMPVGVDRIELYRPPPEPGTELLLRLEVTACDEDGRLMRCNMQAEDAAGVVHVRMQGWTDVLTNWPENFLLGMRLSEYHTLSREAVLPGLPGDAVCMLARHEDFRNVEMRWAASLFLHSQESAALTARQGPGHGPDSAGRFRDRVCSLAATKDAVRLWWARRYGGTMPHPTEFLVNHDELGRPHLEPAGEPSLPCITCAHSGDAFVAIASEAPAGIDLEVVTRDAGAVLPQFATTEEMALLDQASAAEEGGAGVPLAAPWALRLWCAKEAFSKLLGTGLQGRPKDFVAVDADPGGGLLLHHVPTRARYVVYTARLDDYVLAYTTADLAVADGAPAAAPQGRASADGNPAVGPLAPGNGNPGAH